MATPFDLPTVRGLNTLAFHPDVTFLVGENGSGKSTLLEAIAVLWGFNPEGGTINFNFSTRPSHSDLYKYLRVVRSHKRPKDGFFLRAESFFNLATNIEQLDAEPSFTPPVTESYGGRSLHEQSHGESFLTLLLHRFGGSGFYVLDEPEAALITDASASSTSTNTSSCVAGFAIHNRNTFTDSHGLSASEDFDA